MAVYGGNRESMPQPYSDPFFNILNKLFAALFKGLACGPYAFQARYMCIIWLWIIDNFILSSGQSSHDVLREHMKAYYCLMRFSIILLQPNVSLQLAGQHKRICVSWGPSGLSSAQVPDHSMNFMERILPLQSEFLKRFKYVRSVLELRI